MKYINNLKIGSRILIGFFAVVIIAGIIGGVGIYNLQSVNSSYKAAYTDSTAALQYTERISSSFQTIRMNVNGFILAETPQEKEYYIERMNALKVVIDESISEYREMLSAYDPQEVQQELSIIDVLQTSLIAFGEKRNELMQGIGLDPSRRSEAFEWLKEGGELRILATAVDDNIRSLINYNADYVVTQINNNGSQALFSTITIVVVIGIGIVLAIIIALYISRIISKPVKEMVTLAEKLAVGDIDVNVKATSKDEIGDLMHAFSNLVESTRRQAELVEKIADGDMTVRAEIRSDKDVLGTKLSQMLDRLNELLSNINVASEQVAAGSRQVSDSSVELSQGATEQASSLEELTASVEQISSQTKNNAENALEANKIAENAKIAAETGSEHMKNMLSAMDDINESSNNINKIIKVIDDIAFQTNILALNAAVEAARAGQHGKGFAVVAEEVRNLASKSANAAKETAALIEGSIKEVDGGTKIAASTSSSLNEIVGSVSKVAKLVGDIAVASNEQASGIAQINQGLMQVSQVVQANSATSEESASASEELTSQADMLRRQVESFKLRNTSSTYKNKEEASLDADMSDILEKMKAKKKAPTMTSASGKKNISLSDNNFGKY